MTKKKAIEKAKWYASGGQKSAVIKPGLGVAEKGWHVDCSPETIDTINIYQIYFPETKGEK